MKCMNRKGSRYLSERFAGKLCCASLALLVPLPLWAQVPSADLLEMSLEQLSQVVVTVATGTVQNLKNAPAIATVFTAEDIKAMGATELDQVLEAVPGMHVSRSANRLNAIYSIRGNHSLSNSQVLLMMNGVPVKDIYTGGLPPNFRLPVANIARIEVIRGPGSALYGADAFAGVINVITKNAKELGQAVVGVRGGSFGSRDAWAQHGGAWGGWDVAFSAEMSRSDGDRERRVDADLQTTFDSALGTSASRAPGPLDTRYDVLNTHLNLSRDEWSIKLWSWRQDNAGIGPGVAQALDPAGYQDVSRYQVDAGFQNLRLADQWGMDARLSYGYMNQQEYFNIFPAGTRLLIGADGNVNFTAPAGLVDFPDGLIGKPGLVERNLALAAMTSYEGWTNQRLRIGAGVQRNEARTNEAKNFGPGVINGTVSPIGGALTDVTHTANKYMLDTGRTLVYALIQDEWQMRRDLALTAGLRYDHYSDFGSTLNPRFALVWETSDRLTSKLLYGQAFRAPSFVELYAVNNPAYLGSRKNVPETIKTLELAFDYQPVDTLRTALNLFGYVTKDNIEFRADPAPATTTSAQNIKGQRGHGFELEGEWRPDPAVQLRANYAWQHSELRATGQRVADAPGQRAFFDARWKFLPGWTAGAQVNRVADRKRVAGDTRDAIKDYTTVDMTLRHQFIAQNMELAASVRNAFNADAREPSNGTIPGDYPLEKRSFHIELKYALDARSAKP